MITYVAYGHDFSVLGTLSGNPTTTWAQMMQTFGSDPDCHGISAEASLPGEVIQWRRDQELLADPTIGAPDEVPRICFIYAEADRLTDLVTELTRRLLLP